MTKEELDNKFIKVYQAYVDEIYHYVYLRTGLNQALAEDVTQDIFTDVYRAMGSFRGLCSQKTWIYRITRNKVNDFYRSRYRKSFDTVEIDELLSDTLPDTAMDIPEQLIEEYECETVHKCLRGLKEQYQIVLTLKYIDEKSVAEIAEIVGKTNKACESILQRAKRAFEAEYTAMEENYENR